MPSMNLLDYPKVATLAGSPIVVVPLVDRFPVAIWHREEGAEYPVASSLDSWTPKRQDWRPMG